MNSLSNATLFTIFLALGAPHIAQAQDKKPKELTKSETPKTTTEKNETSTQPDIPSPSKPKRPNTVTIIGSKEEARGLPGSAFFIDSGDIRDNTYDDINQILRKVPGATLRSEDGFGLFPNISLRGVDTNRSSKVTIMEDGVLVAPAPYSAPSAYYSPTGGRMYGIEIIKGSSQIQHGPHITGGVINYLSTPIPTTPSGYLKTIYGTDNEYRLHLNYGATHELSDGSRFGYVGEFYYRSSEGFKDIDNSANFDVDRNTGFRNIEPMFKVMWEPNSERYQRFEFKYGYTDRDANETYTGLSEADFKANPTRRYQATRFDEIDSYQNRIYLRHFIEVDDTLSIETTAYYNNFHRNWYKLHDLRSVPDGMGGTTNMSISSALAGANGGRGLALLNGTGEGTLRVRANNRDYYAYGVEVRPTWEFESQGVNHTITLGIRYHVDRVRRFQRNDFFAQDAMGLITSFTRGTNGDAGNRRQETRALAIFLQDKIEIGKFTITPGVRVEQLWQDHDDFDRPDRTGTNSMSLLGGGVGVTYKASENLTLLAGIHRGFSPPNPRAAVKDGLEEEKSTALEAGFRYQDGSFGLEVIGFYTHFEDLIVLGNIGGAGGGESENVGEVDSLGVEILFQYDPLHGQGCGYQMPSFISFTYNDATLDGDANSTDPESIFAGGLDNNKVPYIPEYSLTLGTGVELTNKKAGVFITANFVDDVFTTASNTTSLTDPDGDPDSRFGELDSRWIVDISAYVQLKENVKLLGGIHNVFDEEYVASRHPHGPRPGRPRFFYIGLEMKF